MPRPKASSLQCAATIVDRKSTRLNSSHTEIYTLSLHDALPILVIVALVAEIGDLKVLRLKAHAAPQGQLVAVRGDDRRSEEHTSELQSHRDLHSFPTRRSSDLGDRGTRGRDRRPESASS